MAWPCGQLQMRKPLLIAVVAAVAERGGDQGGG